MDVKRKRKHDPNAEHAIFLKGRKAQPAGLFALFSIIGIAVLFLTILVMFAISAPARHLGGQNFPWLFYVSTPLILACSYTIEKTKRAFRTDNGEKLLRYQLWTFACSIVFCVIQYFAWRQLWTSGITMTAVNMDGSETISNSGAYLFVLSGLHVVHLLGGMGFLFSSMYKLIYNRTDMVRAVVYFSDKREGGRISALALYWHFLGGLWCVMFGFFLWYFV